MERPRQPLQPSSLLLFLQPVRGGAHYLARHDAIVEEMLPGVAAEVAAPAVCLISGVWQAQF